MNILPRNDDPIIGEIKNQMKKRFANESEYGRFIANHGYPLWNDYRQYGGNYIIPFVRKNQDFVNSFYFVSTSESRTYNFAFYDVDATYNAIAKAPDCDSPFAPIVVTIEVEENVFGRSLRNKQLYGDGGIMSKLPDDCPTVTGIPGTTILECCCIETAIKREGPSIQSENEDPTVDPLDESFETDVITDQIGLCPTFCDYKNNKSTCEFIYEFCGDDEECISYWTYYFENDGLINYFWQCGDIEWQKINNQWIAQFTMEDWALALCFDNIGNIINTGLYPIDLSFEFIVTGYTGNAPSAHLGTTVATEMSAMYNDWLASDEYPEQPNDMCDSEQNIIDWVNTLKWSFVSYVRANGEFSSIFQWSPGWDPNEFDVTPSRLTQSILSSATNCN